ncbi:endonuclease [Granulosicoccus antarcticus]|uniref:Extracellular ribonuclease n=1 Tax=Granulosicoccus antarcticus IMCC3135 TaxID=1192854 RepID=A0A2Z2NR78_9GAMM|nr:endonuclease [Granulosicoccus antarcticus]ASJ73739.1 Extracellular ribonuclease [Granulosicoccus antarcticus IMCC3135]
MSTLISQIDSAEERFAKSRPERNLVLDELSRFAAGEKTNWQHLDKRSRYRTRLERLGQYADADAITDDQSVSFNPLERILDASELSSVEFFERGVIAARSVARVQIRNDMRSVVGYGSGVMIGPGLFMTNNHVLSTVESAASSTLQFDYLTSISGVREPVAFALNPQQFFVTDERLDFTIVALLGPNEAGNQPQERGWSPLIANSGKATIGERVNIIQHPGGERMQVVVRDNTVIGVVDSFLHYRADTQPGSSGSPVFNDQWELAALHHAGKPKRNSQGKIMMIDGQPWTGNKADIPKIDWEANEGTRISEIVRFVNQLSLNAQHRILWEQAQLTAPTMDFWSLFEGKVGSINNEYDRQVRPEPGLSALSVDDSGNPSWLFRLSFGPVSAGAMAPTASNVSTSPPTPPTVITPPSVPGTSYIDPLSAAQRIIECFQPEEPYFDKNADAIAMEKYWGCVDPMLPSAEIYPILRQHLETTHTGRHSYTRARHEFLYPVIDLHPDGNLHNIYSGEIFSPVEAIATEIAALVPFSEAIGLDIGQEKSLDSLLANESLWDDLERSAALSFNCEHVVCQSWFDKRQPMKADLHHLFACQPGCNSFRSNIPYWQFDPTDEAIRQACGRIEGRSKFEPERGKGAVARATMYFLMRYPGVIGDQAGELTKSRVKILVDWHKEFPVDEYEKHRNSFIEKAQGNRNPFIDFPDIATQALLERGFG